MVPAVKRCIIATAVAVRTESDHTKKPQIAKSLKRKKNRTCFSIAKKEAKEKKAKTRPQVDLNPCSTGPAASTLPADPFYFVATICRLRQTDFQNSITTDSSSSGGSTTCVASPTKTEKKTLNISLNIIPTGVW